MNGNSYDKNHLSTLQIAKLDTNHLPKLIYL